jgi:hypothetical protein
MRLKRFQKCIVFSVGVTTPLIKNILVDSDKILEINDAQLTAQGIAPAFNLFANSSRSSYKSLLL